MHNAILPPVVWSSLQAIYVTIGVGIVSRNWTKPAATCGNLKNLDQPSTKQQLLLILQHFVFLLWWNCGAFLGLTRNPLTSCHSFLSSFGAFQFSIGWKYRSIPLSDSQRCSASLFLNLLSMVRPPYTSGETLPPHLQTGAADSKG